MKNGIAIVITVVIVALCAYGIYKQISDFLNENQVDDVSYIYTENTSLI